MLSATTYIKILTAIKLLAQLKELSSSYSLFVGQSAKNVFSQRTKRNQKGTSLSTLTIRYKKSCAGSRRSKEKNNEQVSKSLVNEQSCNYYELCLFLATSTFIVKAILLVDMIVMLIKIVTSSCVAGFSGLKRPGRTSVPTNG